MNIYEIKGKKNSKYDGKVFGYFTTDDLAKKGWAICPEDIRENTEIAVSEIHLNTLSIGDEKTDLTKVRSPQEIIAGRDENNYAEGYVHIKLSDATGNTYEDFLDIISEKLVGSDLLMDINYKVVAIAEDDTMVLRVSGDLSSIFELEDMDDDLFQ